MPDNYYYANDANANGRAAASSGGGGGGGGAILLSGVGPASFIALLRPAAPALVLLTLVAVALLSFIMLLWLGSYNNSVIRSGRGADMINIPMISRVAMAISRRIKPKCYDENVSNHPSLSIFRSRFGGGASATPKGPETILKLIAFLIITVTAQCCASALVAGSIVSSPLLVFFSVGMTLTVCFTLFFLFAGDFSMSLLLMMGLFVVSIVNYAFIAEWVRGYTYLYKGLSDGEGERGDGRAASASASSTSASATASVVFYDPVEVAASFPMLNTISKGIAVLLILQTSYWCTVLLNMWLMNDLPYAVAQCERLMGMRLPAGLRRELFALSGVGAKEGNVKQHHHGHSHNQHAAQHSQQHRRHTNNNHRNPNCHQQNQTSVITAVNSNGNNANVNGSVARAYGLA